MAELAGAAGPAVAPAPSAPDDPAPALRAPTGAPAPVAPQRLLTRHGRRRRPSGAPPPLPRSLNRTGRYWLGGAIAILFLWVVLEFDERVGSTLTFLDDRALQRIAQWRWDGGTTTARALHALGSDWVQRIARWAALIVLLAYRRVRFAVVTFGLLAALSAILSGAQFALQRPRPYGVEIIGDWIGFSQPSVPVGQFAATCLVVLYALMPQGRWRNRGKVLAAVLVVSLVLARLYLAVEGPSDALVATVISVTVMLVGYRLLMPYETFPISYHRGGRSAHLTIDEPRLAAIRKGVEEQLGLVVLSVEPFGLAGSAGSTPLRICVQGDPNTNLFGKLYAATHLRADRFYKFGRRLLYGQLEDETAFGTVRRLVQQEDYTLRLAQAAGLPSAEPYGIVEITPEREYLLVTEFIGGAKELGESEIDDDIIDQGLVIIRRLWDAGLAHRDIKPANLIVRDGKLYLIDVAFSEVRPSPWRQAVDLANMMLVLALRAGPERVYARALHYFSVDEVAEALAATRGLTMPSQLRQYIKAQGRDLHAELKRLLPYEPRPIAIQRWSARRVGLTVFVLVCGVLFVALLIGNAQDVLLL